MKIPAKYAALALASLPWAAYSTAQADDDRRPRECSVADLRGLYSFTATGFNITANGAQPKAVTLFIRFGGDGMVTAPAATISLNGFILRPTLLPGTYTVEADCTGKLQFGPPGPGFDLFVSPHGSSLAMSQTVNPVNNVPTPGVLEGRAHRVGR